METPVGLHGQAGGPWGPSKLNSLLGSWGSEPGRLSVRGLCSDGADLRLESRGGRVAPRTLREPEDPSPPQALNEAEAAA